MAKKKRGNTLLYSLIFIVVALVAAAMIFKNNKSKSKGTEIYTETIKKRTIIETVAASGRIFPEEELSISSDVSGEIVDLYVEEGDTVKIGQLLAKIDPEIYKSVVDRAEATANSSRAQLADSEAQIAQFKSNLKQAEAQKRQIEAQIENSRATYNRNLKLNKDGVISNADLEASKSSLRALEANLASSVATIESAASSIESGRQRAKAAKFTVKSAEASAKEAKKNLGRTTLTAPRNGVISKLNVKRGERVVGTSQMAGTEIMRIANMNSMEVQVDVSENDVLKVKLKDTADIEVDAYLDRTFKGLVTQISNSANNTGSANVSLNTDQVTNFTVKIRLLPDSYADLVKDKRGYPFRPGMSASVDILTNRKKDILTASIQAVTTRTKENEDGEEEDLDVVVFLYENDIVRTKTVKTGIQDDKYIELLSGVMDEEEIALGPYSAVARTLKDSSLVTKVDKSKINKKGKK